MSPYHSLPSDDGLVIPPPLGGPALSGHEAVQVKNLLGLLAGRRAEALRLYEPLPIIEAFHQDLRSQRIIRGSNRAGKTLGAAAEVARAVTGQDPFGKWPATDGRFWIVGFNGRHLGQVQYRKLFRADAFKIIRDLDTGLWRAYRPHQDAGREHERKPAPPLIPARFVKSIAWENKKEMTPSVITLTNGWELLFISSNAMPTPGQDIDGGWFDEEIINELWYSETVARLLDRKGRLIWSATPQASTQQLYDLSQRAEAGDPHVSEYVTLLEDNPHIATEEKLKLAASLTEEERRVRIYGEFALTGYTVYPEFAMSIHGCEPFPVPADWCKYVAVDPGRQVCAVLFAAIPPPGDPRHDRVYFYKERYLLHCDAQKFGAAMHEELQAQTPPQASIIDGHAGRVSEMGSGLTVEEQYSQALKERGVSSFATGHGFLWGSDDVKAGLQAFRGLLRIRPDGTPRLQVFARSCPNFEREIKRYRYKAIKTADGKLPSDEPEKKNDHLMDCGRYLAAHGLAYVKPRKKKTKGYVHKYLDEKKARLKERLRRLRSVR